MITKFKIFEDVDYDESKYIGKFCALKSDDNDIKMTISLCTRVDFHDDFSVFAVFDCFDIDKNDNISDPVGDHENFTKDEFKKINFMTSIEFYNSHKDICEKLYFKISEDIKKIGLEYWKLLILRDYKKVLDTIPYFKFFVDSDKFNI